MNALVFPSIIVTALLATSSALAAMAVIDVSAIGKLTTQITELQKQSQHLVDQYEKLKEQQLQLEFQSDKINKHYHSVTGNRGYGSKYTKDAFKDNLPEDWEGTYKKIRTQGSTALTQRAKQIYDDNHAFDACAVETNNEEEQQNCTAGAAKMAQDQAFALDMLEAAQTRHGNIKKLLEEIGNTQDPKEIAELHARIAIEQSAMENDRMRLEIFKLASEAEDRLHEQRQRELNAKTWSTRNMD